jgi:putative addiction module component (TIGR02574 family)
MHGPKEIIREAAELPIEERALVIDALLKTLNPQESDIDRQWVAAARRRLEELRAGTARPVPGTDVFARIRERFTG